MTPSLYYNTVTPLLREILDKLMRAPNFLCSDWLAERRSVCGSDIVNRLI